MKTSIKQDNTTVYSEMNGSNYSQSSNTSKTAEERRKELENLKKDSIIMV